MEVFKTNGFRTVREGNYIEAGNGDYIAKNSEVFLRGNIVAIDADGWLVRATGTVRASGIVLEDFTATSDNQTVAQQGPKIHIIAPHVEYYAKSNADLVQADLGKHFRVATSSGVQTVDKTTGAEATAGSQVVKVVRLAPFSESDGKARECIVTFVTR
jgi:2-methylaconitate cis-trans-isomerase PrpF